MVDKVPNQSLWPTERKPKPKNLKQDELGFSYTPNGSFYDMDDEYFNKNGFDVNGGWYTKEKEYIMGPDWLSDLGCYAKEKDKYENIDPLGELPDDEWEDIPNNENDLNDKLDDLEIDDYDDIDYEKILKEAEEYKSQIDSTKTSVSNQPAPKKSVRRAKKAKK